MVGCASKPCKQCRRGGGGEPRLARGEGRGVFDDEEERSELQRELDDALRAQEQLQNQILNGQNQFNPIQGVGPQLGGFGGLQQLPVPQNDPFGGNGNGLAGQGQIFTPPNQGAGQAPAAPQTPATPPLGQVNAILSRREQVSPSRGFRAAFETTHGDDVGEVPTPRRTLGE